MPVAAQQRLDWVDIVKGASILLVVLYHIGTTIGVMGFDAGWLVKANLYLTPVRMPAFFMAAGFFARSSIRQSWPTLTVRRIGFYLYMFVLWSALRYAFFALVIANPRIPIEGHSLRWFFMSILVPETAPWFVWALAIFYFLTKLVDRVPRPVILVIAAMASMLGFSNLFPLPLGPTNAIQYFIFFYAAAHYRELIATLRQRPMKLALASLPLFAVCTVIANGSQSWWVDGPTQFMAAFGGIGGMVAAAGLLEATPVGNVLAYFGRHTLPIYVLHIMLVTLGAWCAVRINWPVNAPGALGLTATLMVVGVGGALLFEKVSDLTKASRVLFRLPLSKRASAPSPA